VTNAFKHGFGTVNKTLDVSLKKTENGLYELQVKDNGNGLQDDIDLVSADSMGLRLIRRLAKQLHGGFEYEYLNGATFKVKFRDTETRKLVE
jgi:two-component sensor histidine kinase